MGYVEAALAKPGTALDVDIRGRRHPATVVKLPFWRATEVKQPVLRGTGEA
jgi:aminomethyltransferase